MSLDGRLCEILQKEGLPSYAQTLLAELEAVSILALPYYGDKALYNAFRRKARENGQPSLRGDISALLGIFMIGKYAIYGTAVYSLLR